MERRGRRCLMLFASSHAWTVTGRPGWLGFRDDRFRMVGTRLVRVCVAFRRCALERRASSPSVVGFLWGGRVRLRLLVVAVWIGSTIVVIMGMHIIPPTSVQGRGPFLNSTSSPLPLSWSSLEPIGAWSNVKSHTDTRSVAGNTASKYRLPCQSDGKLWIRLYCVRVSILLVRLLAVAARSMIFPPSLKYIPSAMLRGPRQTSTSARASKAHSATESGALIHSLQSFPSVGTQTLEMGCHWCGMAHGPTPF